MSTTGRVFVLTLFSLVVRRGEHYLKRAPRGYFVLALIAALFVLPGAADVAPAITYEEGERIANDDPTTRPQLKQLALAMHNYHSLFGHFPPAVLTGPDGKTTYSWRVELLPLLLGKGIDQLAAKGIDRRRVYWKLIEDVGYHLDEPWDGPRNRQFVFKGPTNYRHFADEKSTHSSYFVITGKETVFGDADGSSFQSIKDSTSETFLVVQAKRNIPWTKPVDIAFDPDQPLPEFGGYLDSGFLAATCDGAVHFIPSGAPKKELVALVTKAAGDTFHGFRQLFAEEPAAPAPAERNPRGDKDSLKRIGLAMHLYHDVFNHFPPAVLTGPDGKTPYSWRVALLPMLKHELKVGGIPGPRWDRLPFGQNAEENRRLYSKLIEEIGYDVSEPWNGPHNRALLAQIPSVYRHSGDADGSEQSAFFVLTGPATLFSDDVGINLRAIPDGPENTLMIVEARRDIPWTKPEDIPYDAKQPLPKLGGFGASHFLLQTCDGAVHSVAASTAEKDLRALITRDGKDTFTIPGIPFSGR